MKKKRAAVWKFKIERVSFMNSNTTAQQCYQQPQLKIMLQRTHTQKRTSLKNKQEKCVLIDIIIHMFLHYFTFFAEHILSFSEKERRRGELSESRLKL